MKDIPDIINEWEYLIDCAKNECVFGEPLDTEQFRMCMNDAFELFFPGGERKEKFDKTEIELYGIITAYSQMPPVIQSENSALFKASLNAAADFAEFILYPGVVTLNGSRMEYGLRIMNSGEEEYNRTIVYDFKTGDLSDYIDVVENGY